FTVEKNSVELEVNSGSTLTLADLLAELGTITTSDNDALADLLAKLGTTVVSDNDALADLTIHSDNFGSLDQTTVSTGNIVRIYVTDPSDNTVYYDIEVDIVDNLAPEFTIQYTTATLEVDKDGNWTLADIISQLGTITVSDNDASSDLTIKSTNFSSLNQTTISDNNKVIIYVEDITGQRTSHEITVNIVDTTTPVFTIQYATATLEASKDGSWKLTDILSQLGDTVVSDNDAGSDLTIKSDNFTDLDQTVVSTGNTVTIYVKDKAGLITSHNILVDIVDTVDPEITFDLNSVNYGLNANVSEEQFLSDIGFSASDNSASFTVTTDYASVVNWATGGEFTITVTVSDGAGNTITQEITVYVFDEEYVIEADDFTVDYATLKTHMNNGTVTELVIEKANAKGWHVSTLDGETELPITVKVETLESVSGKTVVDVELNIMNTKARSEEVLATKTIQVTVVENITGGDKPTEKPQTEITNNSSVNTHDSLYQSSFLYGILLLLTLTSILVLKRRKETTKG
ncbi:MAG: LapB repeat-containing protein, partial [Coprobacillaceae bacterium]